ncbi:MAG: hypothetical protein JNK57_02890 [Planctomycetaceae bacterium]|nr:hypothetical protein [Planctomycetaceae bacterium]
MIELIRAGVVLNVDEGGRLRYDGPADSLGGDVIERMRGCRDELRDAVERWSERAAIREFDGGMDRADAERMALIDVAMGAGFEYFEDGGRCVSLSR